MYCFLCGTWICDHCTSFWTCMFYHNRCIYIWQQSHACSQYGSTNWSTLQQSHNRNKTICREARDAWSSWIWSESRTLGITRISTNAWRARYVSPIVLLLILLDISCISWTKNETRSVLLFIFSVVRWHMNIVGISGLVTFATQGTIVAGNSHMFALNVVVQVGRLCHITTISTTPFSR